MVIKEKNKKKDATTKETRELIKQRKEAAENLDEEKFKELTHKIKKTRERTERKYS